MRLDEEKELSVSRHSQKWREQSSDVNYELRQVTRAQLDTYLHNQCFWGGELDGQNVLN